MSSTRFAVWRRRSPTCVERWTGLFPNALSCRSCAPCRPFVFTGSRRLTPCFKLRLKRLGQPSIQLSEPRANFELKLTSRRIPRPAAEPPRVSQDARRHAACRSLLPRPSLRAASGAPQRRMQVNAARSLARNPLARPGRRRGPTCYAGSRHSLSRRSTGSVRQTPCADGTPSLRRVHRNPKVNGRR